MSTIYSAHWSPRGASGVTFSIPICRSFYRYSAWMFRTWKEWENWLIWQNQLDAIKILDEHGNQQNFYEFMAKVKQSNDPKTMREWVAHQVTPPDRDKFWLDDEGYLFELGSFE